MGQRLTSTTMLLLAGTMLSGGAWAETADADQTNANSGGLDTIIVKAVPVDKNILPTTLSSSSTYGLDLGVMETPRNTTILSHAQLDNVNLQDPRGFSYLTSSSYTDSAFGGPNVPRIRGQYGDVFFNGMRSSFTSNGYGAPLSFNSIETINITKGPASVIAGPGPGVGGSVDFITKLPDSRGFSGSATVEFSTTDVRRWNLDFGGPIEDTSLAYRFSYSGEQSDSYFIGHFYDAHSVYGVITGQPSDIYSFQFNTEFTIQNYQEDVGVNRVNQALIDHNTYLTGSVPQADIFGFGTTVILGNPVKLGRKITIDESPGTSGHSLLSNAQLIQNVRLGDFGNLTNNTFFNYENRDNQAEYYYADDARDTFTIENRTSIESKFDTPIGGENGLDLKNDINYGLSLRVAHVNYISNFNNEPPSVYDLTGDPNSWIFPAANQASGDSVPYVSALGRIQYGTPGRDSVNAGDSSISNLYDVALYFEHKLNFTPELSFLYGGRYDLAHAEETDPLTPLPYPIAFTGLTSLPARHYTPWLGIANGNLSPVYQFAPWGSFYLTYDYTQNISGTSGDGGVGTYQGDDKQTFQQTSRLYEAGLKLNLLDKKLFWGSAIFDQTRYVPAGPNGTGAVRAKITGLETELNYQPNGNIFMTASYSFIRTRLASPTSFYNFPAYAGTFVDGAGSIVQYLPNQGANDPGVPQHVFNFLGNYEFNNGVGVRLGVQVTGPIDTTSSGYIDTAASNIAAANNGLPALFGPGGIVPQSVVNANGYYKSPQIPWQYTLNLAAYYDTGPYEFKLSIYNLTDQKNWQSSDPFYGNDFLVMSDPISFDITAKVKF